MLATATKLNIKEHPDIVIFSDLHMGGGGRRDEFRRNSALFNRVLNEYYLKEGSTLVLNGDVEELHKYSYRKIRQSWDPIYETFHKFHDKGKLFKLVGNHDDKIANFMQRNKDFELYDALEVTGFRRPVYLYHGHQSARRYIRFNEVNEKFLKYVAKPLGIKNWAKAHDNDKQIKVEHRLYEFSLAEGIISVVGHTHRPLFESLSEADLTKFFIEFNLRRYSMAKRHEKKEIEAEIKRLKVCFEEITASRAGEIQSCVYSSEIPVPCLFNSGAVLGKRGMTCLELTKKDIRLVHWYDDKVKKKFVNITGTKPEQPCGKGVNRLVMREREMNYITDCIDLLTKE